MAWNDYIGSFLDRTVMPPISSKKYAFDISRGLHHFYKFRDDYSVASDETKALVMKTVLEPVAM